jgi:hypothetical protein
MVVPPRCVSIKGPQKYPIPAHSEFEPQLSPYLITNQVSDPKTLDPNPLQYPIFLLPQNPQQRPCPKGKLPKPTWKHSSIIAGTFPHCAASVWQGGAAVRFQRWYASGIGNTSASCAGRHTWLDWRVSLPTPRQERTLWPTEPTCSSGQCSQTWTGM